MTKNKQKNMPGLLVILLGVLLLFQLIMIGYCNFALSRNYLDCDFSMLYVHAVEMWRNKTFLIPDWSYITTLELDCPLLLAVPLFGLVGDIFVAYAIANLIFVLLLIWTIFRLFEGEEVSYPLLACVLILIPYGIGQLHYMNMLFFNGSQYIIKVMLPLMLVALLLKPYERSRKGKMYHFKQLSFMVIFFLLVFITGFSSGVYVAATGLFPVIVGGFLWKLYNGRKVPLSFYVYSGVTGACTVLGMVLNAVCDINSKGNSMALCDVFGQLQDNISSCLIGIFELFGGAAYSNVEVMSYDGLYILSRMFFVFGILGCGIFVWRKLTRREADELSSVLLAIFVWNTFILCICNVRYGSPSFEYRYHLMGMIPMLCIAVKVMLDWKKKCQLKTQYIGVAVGLAVVLVLNLTSYKTVFGAEKDCSELEAVCEYAKEVGAEYVYYLADSSSAEISRLLDYENEDTTYLTVMWDGTSVAYDYYGEYVGTPAYVEDALIIAEDLGKTVELFGRKYNLCENFGSRYVYR